MLNLDILTQLARYLAGEWTLATFEDWFVQSALSVVDEHGSLAARDLAYEIELRLAEFSHGDWTEHELRRLLLPLIEHYVVTKGPGTEVQFSSSGAVTSAPMPIPGLAVGTRPVRASA